MLPVFLCLVYQLRLFCCEWQNFVVFLGLNRIRCGCVYHTFFIHSSGGHLGLFHILNMWKMWNVSLMQCVCIFWVFMWQCGCWIIQQIYFCFFKRAHIIFHSNYTSLSSRCVRVPFSLHLQEHLLAAISWILAVLTGLSWYLSVVLICILLIAVIMSILSIYLLSFVFLLLRTVYSGLFFRLFLFLLLFWVPDMIWYDMIRVLSPLSDKYLENNLSHSVEVVSVQCFYYNNKYGIWYLLIFVVCQTL